MTGTMTDAAYAATLPGACFLGEGSFRVAYLINGIVYKVTWDGDGCGDNANLSEWEHYHKVVASLPVGVKVPATTLYPVGGMPVIAMEHVKGLTMGECYCTPDEECDDDCLPTEIVDSLYRAGLSDCGYGNVIRDERGTYWVVDFQ